MSEFITPSDLAVEPGHRNSTDLIRDEIANMCLSLLSEIDSGRLKNLPINERSLRRGINGESLDDKTIRTISCLFYKTEEFSKLYELVSDCLKPIIERANNKLTHSGSIKYEVSSNPELIQLWNLCSGLGCTLALGKKRFGDKFAILINTLEEHKLVTKSVLQPDCWIMSGDMIASREDGLNHYKNMFDMIQNGLLIPENGKFIQFSAAMRESAFLKLGEDMANFFYERVSSESLGDGSDEELLSGEPLIKLNYQASLCKLDFSQIGGNNEIH